MNEKKDGKSESFMGMIVGKYLTPDERDEFLKHQMAISDGWKLYKSDLTQSPVNFLPLVVMSTRYQLLASTAMGLHLANVEKESDARHRETRYISLFSIILAVIGLGLSGYSFYLASKPNLQIENLIEIVSHQDKKISGLEATAKKLIISNNNLQLDILAVKKVFEYRLEPNKPIQPTADAPAD